MIDDGRQIGGHGGGRHGLLVPVVDDDRRGLLRQARVRRALLPMRVAKKRSYKIIKKLRFKAGAALQKI